MAKITPSFSGRGSPKLTPNQAEVLHLILHEGLTIEKVSIRRKKSVRAVQMIVKKLVEMGLLSRSGQDLRFFDPTSEGREGSTGNEGGKFRLHGQQFHVNFLYVDVIKYRKVLKKASVLYIDGNTVELNRDSLDISINKSYFGFNINAITAESLAYLQRFLIRLERDLGLILVKERCQNIRLTNSHYAEINNGLAKSCNETGDKIKVFGRDDGKLWFLIDNSFNLHEAETVHPKKSKEDMQEIVSRVFNDYRDGTAVLPGDMLGMLLKVEEQILLVSKLQEVQIRQTQIVLDLIIGKRRPSSPVEPFDKEKMGWYIG